MEFLWRFHSLLVLDFLPGVQTSQPSRKAKKKSTMSSSLLMKNFMGFSLRLILFWWALKVVLYGYMKNGARQEEERVQSYLWRMEISFRVGIKHTAIESTECGAREEREKRKYLTCQPRAEKTAKWGRRWGRWWEFSCFSQSRQSYLPFFFFIILDYEINEYVILVILVYTMWKISLRVNIPTESHPRVLLDNIVCLDILLRHHHRHRRRVLVICHSRRVCVCCVCSTFEDIAWVSYQSKSNPLSIQSWRRRRWLFSICDNV